MTNKISIALVGMDLGAEFAPIYLHHPDINRVVIYDSNEARVKHAAEKFGVEDWQKLLDAGDSDLPPHHTVDK